MIFIYIYGDGEWFIMLCHVLTRFIGFLIIQKWMHMRGLPIAMFEYQRAQEPMDFWIMWG